MTKEVKNTKKVWKRRCSNCNGVVQYAHKSKPKVCPYCGDEFWSRPKDEALLARIQDEYINSGKDKEVLGKMLEPLTLYSKKILLSIGKKIHFVFNDDLLNEKVDELVINFFSYYLKRDFYIQLSFGAYLKRMARQVLWGKNAREDDHVSLNAQLEDNHELLDLIIMDNNGDKYIDSEEKYVDEIVSREETIHNIMDIIFKSTNRVKINFNYKSVINMLYGIDHGFDRKDNFIDKFYEYVGVVSYNHISKLKLLILRYLKSGDLSG